MTEQQFLRQIKRLLHCKADKKREILRQLESDIARCERRRKELGGDKAGVGEHQSSLLVNLTKMGGT